MVRGRHAVGIRAQLRRRAEAFAAERTEVDRTGTLFLRVLALLLGIAIARITVIAASGVPTFESDGMWAVAIGVACLALSPLVARAGLAEASLVLRSGAALGISGIAFMTTCVDVFHLGRDNPLSDSLFARIDATLGLDWLGYARVLDANDALWQTTMLAYNSIFPQFTLAIAALCFSRSAARLYAYLLAQTLSLCTVASVAAVLPAIGAYAQHGGATAGFQHTFLTADGMTASISWLRSDLSGPGGVDVFTLISFPSFHACSAILFAWAWWTVRFARWPMLGLNAVLLAATPIHGSHYFIDVIAGVGIAGLAIGSARVIVSRLGRA